MEMKKPDSFFRRHKILVIAIVLIMLAVGAVYGTRLWANFSFLLGKDLIIYLTPNEKSLDLHYGDTGQVAINITSGNQLFCRASCNYEFIDRSSNAVLDSGVFNITPNGHFAENYNVSVSRLGTGQDIYNFQVVCRNMYSFFCPVQEDKEAVFRSSLIIVNYELSEFEKELKAGLKQNVTRLLVELAALDESLQGLNQKMLDVGARVNLGDLASRRLELNNRFDRMLLSVENLRAVWTKEDYLRLNREFNETFFEKGASLKDDIGKLNEDLDSTIQNHNSVITLASGYSDNFNHVNSMSKTPALAGHPVLDEVSDSAQQFNKIIISLKDRDFESYGVLNTSLSNLFALQQKHVDLVNNLTLPLLLDGTHMLKSEKDLLCLMANCTEVKGIGPELKSAEGLYLGKKLAAPNPFVELCANIRAAVGEFSLARNLSLEMIKNKSLSFPATQEFRDYVENRKEAIRARRDNIYFDSLEAIKAENASNPYAVNAYSNLIPINKSPDFAENPDFEALNLTLYHYSDYSPPDTFDEFANGTCNNLGNKAMNELYSFDFRQVEANQSYSIKSGIDTSLSDNPPVCCVFNECNPCCADESCISDPKTYPVILLHGHSVLKDSSVQYSLDAYNKIQHKLQEDGYINAGILSLYNAENEFRKGEWGLSGRPVTVKVSYYFDAFKKGEEYIVVPTKSETIDTYAVRLKDLVESVRQRTGKPKVNIIANSMGGLVARRYMQIFGAGNVYKLIMTGTPNKGVVGQVKDFCPLLGEGLECRDMQENSLFLNVLNDPARQQPSGVRMYIIAGSGCDTNGKDGDGIVQLDNALISNARPFIIKGKCEFGTYLHTEMLNVDKYPEVYDAIKQILQE